ncbi:PAS domain-containing protein [Sulfurospirillum sp. 1612]|uniref:PAS domain-containing protein n=1 Tax=Sulfurospirillum sp. 1612 TaxID=3094835 RepID=UPI002F93D146
MEKPQPNSQQYELEDNDFIISKTDLKGRITYCNQIFIRLSQYDEKELIGAPHNIIRHPDMPRIIFKLLWERIQSQQEIFAFIKNLTKDGGYYWVFANITASLDINGASIGYYSVRRKANQEAMPTIIALYQKLSALEKSENISASEQYLNDFLEKKEMNYDEWVISLQG